MKRSFSRSVIMLILLALIFSVNEPVQAGLFNKIKKTAKKGANTVKKGVKKVKKKVEHKLGWDRYIHSWGDRFVPDQNRWVAIRSGVKRPKHNIGKFWDIPGDGKKVNGPGKHINLWEITFQEYPQPDRRYRFVPVYETTKNADDFGYYWIQCKTGMWLKAGNKGQHLTVESGYNVHDRTPSLAHPYQWRVKNVGKNRFTILSRKNGLACDARGGKGNKNGCNVQLWNDHGGEPVIWEFIYIAEGNEVKSTGKMAKNRANEVKKAAKKVTDAYGKIAKKVGKSITNQAKKTFNVFSSGKLIELKESGKDSYTFKVGFPKAENQLDKLKEMTLDKLFKLDFKKFKFTPVGKDKICLGIINRLECLGQHVDLSIEFTGDWKIGKNGFDVQNFKMTRFSLPCLPDKLTKGIRNKVSNLSKKLAIHINNYPGKSQLLKNSKVKSNLAVKNITKGKYGFQATMSY